MIFHEYRLPADNSHEISCLILYLLKKRQNFKLLSAAKYRWCFKGYIYNLRIFCFLLYMEVYGINNPMDVASLDPMGLIGRIYVGEH